MATGFKNLRRLSIHIGLGIAHAEDHRSEDSEDSEDSEVSLKEVFSQVLTKSKAEDFAKRFFELRGPSVLEKITLRTGEKLRWFPQWHPEYATAEEECAKIFEIYAPLEDDHEPRLNQLKTEYDRLREWDEERIALLRGDSIMNSSSAVSKPQPLSRSPRVFNGGLM